MRVVYSSHMKTTSSTLGALVLALMWYVNPPARAVQVDRALSVREQNAIVQKYCAVCHDDAKRMGGLTLQNFDAARPDPNVAGMMVSKLGGGAIGAAGIKQPDRPTVAALRSALAAHAVDGKSASGGWTFSAFNDATTERPLVTATMMQEVAGQAGRSGGYELTITCEKTSDLSQGGNGAALAEMRLATYIKQGPDAPVTGRQMLDAVGRSVPFELDGRSVGAAVQYVRQDNVVAAKFVMPLPSHTLTIRNLFPGETVSFPFGQLTPTLREILSTCVSGKS
jgi:hypothetical protein